ncbi:endonuclease/exonuclease/phosphatase family protein [bacterium]|nr:endonuclease/exonuclease/phosphatase family protein [bacterium]
MAACRLLFITGFFFAATAAFAESLEVMTFNLRVPNRADGPDYWELRKPRVAAVLKKYDPDLVGAQEAQPSMLDYLVHEAPQYAWFGLDRDGTGRGETNGVLVKKARFVVRASSTVWLSDTPMPPPRQGNVLPRVVVSVTLECRPSGATLLFINTHFDHQSQPSRERSALFVWALVSAASGTIPTILLGDLNAGPDNPVIRFLRGQAELGGRRAGLPDVYSGLGMDLSSRYSFTAFAETGRPGNVIDWIFFTPDVKVESARLIEDRIDGRWPSDHLPVIATLVLP